VLQVRYNLVQVATVLSPSRRIILVLCSTWKRTIQLGVGSFHVAFTELRPWKRLGGHLESRLRAASPASGLTWRDGYLGSS
jgi:hypothetical protein